ncbi:hypothetical protein [Mesorhizobium sp. WSM3862]|uniref:hypothetical protein n=1 Tax=Mesorhizobium sp. WSM3862 TaxID=632858 RepID=UPI001140940A|nr:hypothetical protein [Mesorhizobium sp. WSM3862]
MTDHTLLPLSPSRYAQEDQSRADGGRNTSDGGVMILAAAKRRLLLVDRLGGCDPGSPDPQPVTHAMADGLRLRGCPTISIGRPQTRPSERD